MPLGDALATEAETEREAALAQVAKRLEDEAQANARALAQATLSMNARGKCEK